MNEQSWEPLTVALINFFKTLNQILQIATGITFAGSKQLSDS